MMTRRHLAMAAGAAVLCGKYRPASAAPLPGPFTLAELEQSAPTYKRWVSVDIFQNGLVGRLSIAQRSQLQNVSLDMPLTAKTADPGYVLTVFSDPAARQVVLPVRTLRWVDEYCGLIAYLENTGCNVRTVLPLIYDAMLCLPHSGAHPPGPFATFGLDDKIYNNPSVKKFSNNLVKSTFTFIVAHELGHLALGHVIGQTAAHSQQQERDADAYAINLMAQIGLYPLGLAIFFSAAAMMEGNQNTHPLSGSRVAAVAEAVERNASSFIGRDENKRDALVQSARERAHEIRQVIELVDSSERRAGILNEARGRSFEQLAGLLRQCNLPPPEPR